MFQIWSWYEKNWGSCEIPPNMDSWESDLSDDMYFVKIIKSFDSKRP